MYPYGIAAAAPGRGMRVEVVTPPAVEPVTVDEAKQWARINTPDDDSLISDLITAVRLQVEADLGRALITQTRTLYLAGFEGQFGEIAIPYPKLQSIVSIQYRGLVGGALLTIDPSVYTYTAGAVPGRVWVPYGSFWPLALPFEDAVQITYTCGYGDTADEVPMPIRLAMRSLIAANYTYRSGIIFGQGGQFLSTPMYDGLLNTERTGEYR